MVSCNSLYISHVFDLYPGSLFFVDMLFTLMLPMAVVWILAIFLLILIYIAKAGNKRRAYDSP